MDADVDVDLGASLSVRNEQLFVSETSRSGLLVDAGIRAGDVIVSVDGRTVTTQRELHRWIRDAGPGERLPLIVLRNGQRQTLYLEGPRGFAGRDIRVDIGATFQTDPRGRVVVSELERVGLLAHSGIRRGDVIIEVGGRPIDSHWEISRIVHYYDEPRLPVVVLRDGRRETIYVTIDSRQREYRGYYPDDYRTYHFDSDRAWLGVYLDTRYTDHAVIEAVQIGSAADRMGLRAGDWILSINGQPIQGPGHLSRTVRSMLPGEEIAIEASRRVVGELSGRLGERPDNRGRFRYDEEMATGESRNLRIEERSYRGEYEEDREDDGDFEEDEDDDESDGMLRGRFRNRFDR